MEVSYVKLDSLRPHPRNAREGDVGAIMESVQTNGIYRPLVVQRSTGLVLAGNHTFAALRILLADNRTSDLATYDDAVLAAILAELADSPSALAGTGYDLDDLDVLLGDLARDVDRASSAPPYAPLGDLRQVILILGTAAFVRLIGIFAEMQSRDPSLDSNTACALRLLDQWGES